MSALVEVKGLERRFDVSKPWLDRMIERSGPRVVHAVGGVSFSIEKGETFALVGESGSGKSTIARITCGLLEASAGEVRIAGTPIGRDLRLPRAVRRRIQMIFQDPYASLNPRWRVRDIVAEPIRRFEPEVAARDVAQRVAGLLATVGLSARDMERYPHQFSGGQRQRVAVARALAVNPEFIVCDEPTSALDVSVQAQILNLMSDLQARLGLTYLFISHNLAVVRHMATNVGVLYLGRLVEVAPAGALFARPLHPYTRLLLAAVPALERVEGATTAVRGEIPDPVAPPPGCHFHPRCPFADTRCRTERPELITAFDARVACHAIEEGRLGLGEAAHQA